jgi:MerR family transcriptional regulator, thiopeptide resistance regulator
MQTTEPKAARLRRIKEFAGEAGVTVRTLQFYDRLGLLKPAELSESGYRLYGEAELERLEHILALRFVGFNLDQIKELLGGASRPLVVALRMQRALIARQKRRLESALAAIDEAEAALSRDDSDVWGTLRTVIEVFKMQNDWDWTKKYYSQEARERLEERLKTTPHETIEQGQRDWSALLADVEEAAAAHVDPASATARALAQRWRDLLALFTQGNAEIQRGLNRIWSDSAHWPSDIKRPWSDEADAFIKKAMDCGH